MTTTSTKDTIELKNFFDKYYQQEVSFPSNQIDAIVGFFLKRGFDEQASKSVSIALLNQARIDSINPISLLDRLKGLTDAQLTKIITDVINVYRDKTSMLGYTEVSLEETIESRNIRL